uniref:AcidPPc domain-containing protein n=1 Tax=Haemonchus contortus TaxID=6289 RepID=A0A7I4Y0U8_HAECO
MEGITRCLNKLDRTLSQRLVAPTSKRNLLLWIEYGVNGYLWVIGSSLALVCSVSGRWNQETQHQLVMLNTGLLLDLIFVCILKLTIQRPRPDYNVNDQKFEAPIADQYSFPSGHSSRAAMLATLSAAFFPKYRIAAALMAVLVAISRVAMGRHYLSDALGGLLLGCIEGVALLALPRGFSRWVRRILH